MGKQYFIEAQMEKKFANWCRCWYLRRRIAFTWRKKIYCFSEL